MVFRLLGNEEVRTFIPDMSISWSRDQQPHAGGQLGVPESEWWLPFYIRTEFPYSTENSKFYSSNGPPRLLFNAHQGLFLGWQGGRGVWLTTTSSKDHGVHKDTPTFTLRLFRGKICAETRCNVSWCDNTWSKAVRNLNVWFTSLLAVTSNGASYNNTLHPTAVTRNTLATLAYLLRNCRGIKMTCGTASRLCEHTISFHKYNGPCLTKR
jgi:hypothetical protein